MTDEIPVAFPPTLREVMLRPRWLAMLALCLIVASVFAWLLQWQLVRAVNTNTPDADATETVRPLTDVAAPGEYFDDSIGGQRVTVRGSWVAGDYVVVANRYNDGEPGFWVTGQFRAADRPASVAGAIGWTGSRDEAYAAADALNNAPGSSAVDLRGRFIQDEGPIPAAREHPFEPVRMSPPQLLAMWHDTVVDDRQVGVWRGFIAAETPRVAPGAHGLQPISQHAPELRGPVNWLNLFYAAEWAIFAVFSFYLWYRLARDAWEREVEAFHGLDPDEA